MNEYTLVYLMKAFHLIFMVAWFAGIFYLPRLFVYHAETNNADVSNQFKIMERRLFWFVTPFALLTLLFGIAMLVFYGLDYLRYSTWLHYKLLLLVILYGYHIYCYKLLVDFRHDRNQRSSKWFRYFNEAPVLLLFAIVLLAVLKP